MGNNIVLQVGVKVLLCNNDNNDGKYLLLHRSLVKYPEIKGRWDIVGGRINAGQTLLENLRREIQEETGLELIGQPELIAAQDIIIHNNNRHVVRLTYLGSAKGDIKLDTEENDVYHWYTRKELANLDDVDIYLKELLNNKSLWDR